MGEVGCLQLWLFTSVFPSREVDLSRAGVLFGYKHPEGWEKMVLKGDQGAPGFRCSQETFLAYLS